MSPARVGIIGGGNVGTQHIMSRARVGIIGGGNVGHTLAKQLSSSGRAVVIGSRNPDKLKQLSDPPIEVVPVRDAVSASDLLILAVPGWRDAAAVATLVDTLAPGGVAGKVVVDATNPLTPFPELEVLCNGTSGGELLAAGLPDAHVYKAFNTLGTSVMAAVKELDYPVQMMFAGPADEQPKAMVAALIADAGFEPVYIGPIRYARNLEALAELWIHLGVPPAGFTKEHFGSLFSFQLQQRKQ